MVKNTNAKFLFIGGAPRSGTTLLVNLFDNHPELLAFPSEHSTIERYFWNKDKIEEYALTDFILKRQEGQQTILANKDLLSLYSEKIKKEYKKEYSLDIDSKKFVENYLESLRQGEINLKEILHSLIFALSKSNSFSKLKYPQVKYFIFKQPYYTDLFANEVFELIPEAKFIHIQRDPIGRYTSAKKRGLIMGKKLLFHINGVNSVEAHSEVDVSSYYLAKANQEKLGSNSYKIITYENMLENPSIVFKEIFSWLAISESDCFLKPTLLGKPALAGSSFIKNAGIDKSAINRKSEYKEITSWNERIMHKYYLKKGGLIKDKKSNLFLIFISFILPFKYESLTQYLYKLTSIWKLLMKNDLQNRLPKGAKKKKYFLSGTI